MWHCPKCGERIDDVFDACWKCGTDRDGILAADFQADPGDSAALDAGVQPDEPDEVAEDRAGPTDDLKNERIVELCSAANTVEAYALLALLEEAGIPSRILGEFLENAAGWLPLGETVAPRIWVREKDAARAREIVEEQADQPDQDVSSLAECDQQAALDEASEEDDVPRAPGARFRRLSLGLLLVGLTCLLAGTVWAGYAWITTHTYSAVAEGAVSRCRPYYTVTHDPPPDIPGQLPHASFSFWHEVQYAFVVDGKVYYCMDRQTEDVVARKPIHYDPHDPATNFAGSLTSPWLVLACALAVGGSLTFIGCCLAIAGRGPNYQENRHEN